MLPNIRERSKGNLSEKRWLNQKSIAYDNQRAITELGGKLEIKKNAVTSRVVLSTFGISFRKLVFSGECLAQIKM